MTPLLDVPPNSIVMKDQLGNNVVVPFQNIPWFQLKELGAIPWTFLTGMERSEIVELRTFWRAVGGTYPVSPAKTLNKLVEIQQKGNDNDKL